MIQANEEVFFKLMFQYFEGKNIVHYNCNNAY
jgi:hypothetical protein